MLLKEHWLPQAKRLAIGMQSRLRHLNEHRPNLVIGNAGDKYWAYCQACKCGAVEMKEHVRLDVFSPEAKRSDLSFPRDLMAVSALAPELQYPILAYIASKGMDACMLPELWYSESRKRILVNDLGLWLGRDVSGKALEKWLTYNKAQYLGKPQNQPAAVVVEDAFSYFKVRWAVPEHAVYCALGTALKPALALRLTAHEEVLFAFDGDSAGVQGAELAAKRMRGLQVQARATCAPTGYDPKDLSAAQLRALLLGENHE